MKCQPLSVLLNKGKLYGLLVTIFLFLGCQNQSHLAPVINAWTQPKAKEGFYRVKKGDSIYSIAWTFGLDYRILAEANHLKEPYHIQVGQNIRMTTTPRGSVKTHLFELSEKNIHYESASFFSTKKSAKILCQVSHWRWPAKGRLIRNYSTLLDGNSGIDIGGYYGSPIYAASDGIVVYSGAGVRGYGNLIIIKHEQRYLSAYAFNKRILVREGSRVRSGQKIAEMGRTDAGRVLLHFEIRRDGKPVNPLFYLS